MADTTYIEVEEKVKSIIYLRNKYMKDYESEEDEEVDPEWEKYEE